MAEQGPVTIESVSPDRSSQALAFLFRSQTDLERRRSIDDLLEQQADRRTRFESFLAASLEGELVGVQIAVRHGRTTCFVWPPVVDEDRPERELVADALLVGTRERLESSDLSMGQVMSEDADERGRARLERNGFSYLTHLEFLQHGLRYGVPRLRGGLQFETFDAGTNGPRFEAMLEATYVDSLDCPGLARRRTAADVLEGHRECGEYDPALWQLFQRDTTDVGLLLLTDHPEQGSREVVYFGVHHDERGHGYGREMLTLALHEARAAGRGSVVLAVDATNTPALRLYDAIGFAPIARRCVHVWYASET